jgi:hypothetical protein
VSEHPRYVRVPLLVRTPDGVGQCGLLDTTVPILALAEAFSQRQVGGGSAVVGGAPRVLTEHGTSVLYSSGLQVHVAMPLDAVAELLNVVQSADATEGRDDQVHRGGEGTNGGDEGKQLSIIGRSGEPIPIRT